MSEIWKPMETAPQDRFILLWCPEDGSRWLAKWQGDQWYGVDAEGLTRSAGWHRGCDRVTGWEIVAWTDIPRIPTNLELSELRAYRAPSTYI